LFYNFFIINTIIKT